VSEQELEAPVIGVADCFGDGLARVGMSSGLEKERRDAGVVALD
jgi:hypothetical protein